MLLLWKNKLNRKIDNGLIKKSIKNIKEENNMLYSANKIGKIIESNLKNKSYKKIYYILKKKNIIMNITQRKIQRKKIFTLINNNLNGCNKNKYFFNQSKIKNWYYLIGSNRISSIPSGLILIIKGRILKLKKASRTKIHRLILGNTNSWNYDIYYKTIIENNGSIGIKFKIYSRLNLKSKKIQD